MMRTFLNCLLFLIANSANAQGANPFGNALVPDMIADASIQEIDGTFYCYATTDGYDQGLKTSVHRLYGNRKILCTGGFQVFISLLLWDKNTGRPAKLLAQTANTISIQR